MIFAIRCSEKIIQCSDSPVSEESALQTLMSIPVATCHQVLLFVSTFLFYPCCAGKLWYVNVQPAVSHHSHCLIFILVSNKHIRTINK